MTAAEAMALREALAGKNFGDICALLQFQDEADTDNVAVRAGGYLAQWFADGLVIEIRDPHTAP